MSELQNLPLSAIAESEHNPRKHFNPEKLAELVVSIKAQGLLQPILVRPLPGHRVATTSRGTTHEIIAGARRFRACKEAGLASILSVVCNLDDAAAMEAALIENLQRDDLSELEEAEGYQQLCDLTHISKEALGDKIGRSRRYVYDRLRLLKLQPLARTSLRDGKISATAALAIATVHDGDLQAKALAHATSTNYAGDQPSTRALQTWMRHNVMLELAKAPFDIKLTTLYPNAGACTNCPKRTGADPDIFAETQGPDMCCDAPCYHSKAEASRQLAHEKFKAQGIKIIDGDEAEGMHMYGERFQGYSAVSQTREDTTDGKPATLLDLLGKKGQAAVGLVAIEHPHSKNVQAYVDTEKAEAWLVANKLVVAVPTSAVGEGISSHNAEATLKRLLAARDNRVKQAGQEATQNAVQEVVLKAPGRVISTNLLTDDFLKAYLTAFINPWSPGVIGLAMDHEREAGTDPDTYREQLEARISRAERSVLLRAFVLILLDGAQDSADNDEALRLLHDAEIDLYETLSKDDSPSLADICTAAEQAEGATIDAEISAVKAQLEPKAKPAKSPTSKPTPKKAKLTPEQEQTSIAEAMQKNEQAAAAAPVFTIGQRVKVLSAEPLHLQKYIGKVGKIKQPCGDNFDVAFHGAGIAEFEPQELETVAA